MNKARFNRRTDAQSLADRMVVLARTRAEAFGCTEEYEINNFALGYMTSLLAQVAAVSPAAIKELQATVEWTTTKVQTQQEAV